MLAAAMSLAASAAADASHVLRAIALSYSSLPTTAAAFTALSPKQKLLLAPNACGILLLAAWLIHIGRRCRQRGAGVACSGSTFHLTRLLLYRTMAAVYCVAFLVACLQHTALHGPHGLQPSLQWQQHQQQQQRPQPLSTIAVHLSLSLSPLLPPPLSLTPDVAFEGKLQTPNI